MSGERISVRQAQDGAGDLSRHVAAGSLRGAVRSSHGAAVPIEYQVRHDLRLVWATARGIIWAEDLFEYQRAVWARPDVRGYHELVDMTAVEDIPAPTPEGIRALATLSASMDVPDQGQRFAIVAPDALTFGLGRMYQTHRGFQGSAKEVAVFRTVPDALSWLGISVPPD
jgi:hypothetical protein